MNAPLPLPPPDDEPLGDDEAKLFDALQSDVPDVTLPEVDLSLEKTVEGDFIIMPRTPTGQPLIPDDEPVPAKVQQGVTGSKLYVPLYAGGSGFLGGTDTGTGSFLGAFSNATISSTAITNVSGNATITVTGGSMISGSSLSVVSAGLPTKLYPGAEMTLELPDGGKLIVEKDGSYRIEDKDAKVTYRAARVRDFNPYLNASDLLGEFIEDLAKLTTIPADKVLSLPIELFINWLIVRAAQADGTPPPPEIKPLAQAALPPPPPKPAPIRCGYCGRYVSRRKADAGLRFCSGHHADQFLSRRLPCPTPSR